VGNWCLCGQSLCTDGDGMQTALCVGNWCLCGQSLCTDGDGMQTALCVGNWCLCGQSLCTDGDGMQKRRECKLFVPVHFRAWAHSLISGAEEERCLELMSPAQILVHGQRCDKWPVPDKRKLCCVLMHVMQVGVFSIPQ
jgi:hypothetical protein